MKIILLIVLVVLCLWVLVAYGRWFVRYKKQQKEQDKAKKLAEFEQKLRNMSDLDLKIWLAGLRKNLYSEDYDSSEMRQIIKKEIKRRGFTLVSLRNFKI